MQPAPQELITLFLGATLLQLVLHVLQERTAISQAATLCPLVHYVQKALTVHLAKLLVQM